MTTPSEKGNAPAPQGPPSNLSDWGDMVPKSTTFADCVSDKEKVQIWNKIYNECGMRSANEKERKMVRAAIYTYCCKNGTSREGEYSGTITLANGQEIEAAVIPRCAGRMKIRKFLRANMLESYDYFKQSRVMEADERFVTKAAAFGVSADAAFALADWLDDCPKFAPAEAKAHQAVFVASIERARRARGGHSLEDVEGERITDELRANGPANAGPKHGQTIDL